MYTSILLVSATPTIVLPHRTPSSSTSDFLSPHTLCTRVSVEGDSGNLVEPTLSCLFLLKMFLLCCFALFFYESHCSPGYPGIHYLGKLTSDL